MTREDGMTGIGTTTTSLEAVFAQHGAAPSLSGCTRASKVDDSNRSSGCRERGEMSYFRGIRSAASFSRLARRGRPADR
jgi:hypothetical protein